MAPPEVCGRFRNHNILSFLDHLRKGDCIQCRNAILRAKAGSKIRHVSHGLMIFVLGALFSPVVQYVFGKFWPFWPASRVFALTSGLRLTQGDGAGCLVYSAWVSSNRGFDNVYLKIRFPMNVSDVMTQFAISDRLSTEPPLGVAPEGFGRDDKGNCKIIQRFASTDSSVRLTTNQRSVEIYIGKQEAGKSIIATVIGKDEQPLGNAEPSIVHEGTFDAKIFGLIPEHRDLHYTDGPPIIDH